MGHGWIFFYCFTTVDSTLLIISMHENLFEIKPLFFAVWHIYFPRLCQNIAPCSGARHIVTTPARAVSQCLASVLIAAIIAGKLQLGWHAETFQRYNNLNLCKISCAPSIMFDVSRTSDLMSKIKCWKITFWKINWQKSRIFTSRHFYLSSGSFISDKLYELVSGTVGRWDGGTVWKH